MNAGHPYPCRATTALLVAVAFISGAILVLGERFDATAGYGPMRPARAAAGEFRCPALR